MKELQFYPPKTKYIFISIFLLLIAFLGGVVGVVAFNEGDFWICVLGTLMA